jgi:hypothetical protein
VSDAEAILARNMEQLPDETKRRRAGLERMAEPRDDEVRCAGIAAGLIAAGWSAELLSFDDRRYPGRTWFADTVRLLRRTESGLVDVASVRCSFDERSRDRDRRPGEKTSGPTYGEIYGAGCDDAWNDWLDVHDAWPTEEEAALIAVAVPDAAERIADLRAYRLHREWAEGGGSGPEPCHDMIARREARHRFTGRVAVVPIIPNRLWRTEPQYGPAGYVRYWPPSEEMPRDRHGIHISVDGGSFHLGHEWGHFVGRKADELLRRDPVARLAVLRARQAPAPAPVVLPDLPLPPAPADFRQAALFA